jgi:hypothetical protein
MKTTHVGTMDRGFTALQIFMVKGQGWDDWLLLQNEAIPNKRGHIVQMRWESDHDWKESKI